VAALVAAGADIDYRDGTGCTLLYNAVWWGDLALAEFLLAFGANPNAPDEDGTQPLHIAASCGSRAVPAPVEGKDYLTISNQRSAETDDCLRLIELLLRHGARVDARDAFGSTPLQVAAGWGHQRVVELLRSHGGDV
jgi:uncharacterized protein